MCIWYNYVGLFTITAKPPENIKSTTISIKLSEFPKIPNTTIHKHSIQTCILALVSISTQTSLLSLVSIRIQTSLSSLVPIHVATIGSSVNLVTDNRCLGSQLSYCSTVNRK